MAETSNKSILKKIREIMKNTGLEALHAIWATQFISPEHKQEYIGNQVSKNMEKLDSDKKVLIEKAANIWGAILFWREEELLWKSTKREETNEEKLFKKYLSDECIKEYLKNKDNTRFRNTLNLKADHFFPEIVETAAKKAWILWELKRTKNTYAMGEYWSEGLKKWSIIYFKENTVGYKPWYQIPEITYHVKDWVLTEEKEEIKNQEEKKDNFYEVIKKDLNK